MKKKIAIILLVFCHQCLFAQENVGAFESGAGYRDSVWLINGFRGLGPLFSKYKFDFVLDARQTLVSGTPARLVGLRFGLEYRRVHRFGFGFYNTGEMGVHVDSLAFPNQSVSEAYLHLAYASVFYERVLYFSRNWEWSATVHFGRGQSTSQYRLKNEEAWKQSITPVSPFELSTTGYYHLTWWCSLGAGVGYRAIRKAPDEAQNFYNAPVAIARLRIRVGKLTKSIWDKDTKYEY